jgi:hypothetical protein
MTEGISTPLWLAILLTGCLFIVEMKWILRRKNWMKSEGRVVGTSLEGLDDNSYACPIVAYQFGEKKQEQICKSNLGYYELGKTVPILINPKTGKIFIVTSQDRWFVSAFLLSCIAALLYFSYSSTDH